MLTRKDIKNLGGINVGGHGYRFKHKSWGQFFSVFLYDKYSEEKLEYNVLIIRYILRNGEKFDKYDAGFDDTRVFYGHIDDKKELSLVLKMIGAKDKSKVVLSIPYEDPEIPRSPFDF